MPTWIDDEGRLRERADDRHQFLRYIPLEFLDPWTSYDSWDAELAIKLITIGYDLDINSYWNEAKDFPYGSTGWDSARAYVDVYQRGMSIAQSSIAAGLLKGPDTPANWLAWAKRKDYDVAHLECPQTAPATDTAPQAPVVADGDAPTKRRNRKPSWATVAMPYMKSLFTAGHFKSASMFYKALMHRAGESDSPFKLVNRELYCTEAGTTVSEGSLGNVWPQIRAH